MLRQELLYFKTENLKFKENLDQFLKLHEAKKTKSTSPKLQSGISWKSKWLGLKISINELIKLLPKMKKMIIDRVLFNHLRDQKLFKPRMYWAACYGYLKVTKAGSFRKQISSILELSGKQFSFFPFLMHFFHCLVCFFLSFVSKRVCRSKIISNYSVISISFILVYINQFMLWTIQTEVTV